MSNKQAAATGTVVVMGVVALAMLVTGSDLGDVFQLSGELFLSLYNLIPSPLFPTR